MNLNLNRILYGELVFFYFQSLPANESVESDVSVGWNDKNLRFLQERI